MTDLIDEATEKARDAFMRAQALASAAERTLSALVRVRDASAGNVADLSAAVGALGATARDAEGAVRDARESADRLLDALGADTLLITRDARGACRKKRTSPDENP